MPQRVCEGTSQVHEENFIRIKTDEVTYYMHIILRADVERLLVDKSLAVEDLPQDWNGKTEEYLGV